MGKAIERSTARLESILAGREESPSGVAAKKERAVELADHLAKLPSDYRTVLELRHLEGLSFREVSERMDRSEGATRMLWLRAIRPAEVNHASGGRALSRPADNSATSRSITDSAWDAHQLRSDQQERLARIMDDCLVAMERGEPIDVDSLCDEHVELADGIRHYLEGLEFVHEAAVGFRPASGRVSGESQTDSDTPGQLGNYRLLREIGRGGMGVVYEAEDVLLNRPVAVKVLPFAALLDQKQIVRFQNEARSAGQLHHPNIVPVYSVGTDRGIHYFAMQFIRGQSLRALLDAIGPRTQAGTASTQQFRPKNPANALTVISGPRCEADSVIAGSAGSAGGSPNDVSSPDLDNAMRSTVRDAALSTRESGGRDQIQSVVRITADVAEALEHAHSRGIIHRDIKPANLLLDDNGKVWVTDFGLARAPQDDGVTLSGDIMGTVRYMSPEQAAGKNGLR